MRHLAYQPPHGGAHDHIGHEQAHWDGNISKAASKHHHRKEQCDKVCAGLEVGC
jgi:hypothetical protein